MKKYIKHIAVVICFVFASSFSHADSKVESLSPVLRALLFQEMLALQQGMRTMHSAYISGDFATVAEIANKMKNSYILKQRMTDDQKRELTTKLPESFLKMDQKFHEYAGILEHFAEEEHSELVGFYYLRLTESCVSCHSQYAKHRFPGFEKKAVDHGHSH